MTASFSIDDRLVYLLSGLHAARYLHNRLTNSVKTLALHQGCLAAPLSPQGRAEGFYSVTRVDKEAFLLIGDGGESGACLAALMRYKVADRVDVLDATDTHSVFHLTTQETARLTTRLQSRGISLATPGIASGIFLNSRGSVYRNRRGTLGIDIVIPRNEQDSFSSELLADGFELLSSEEAARLRIVAGVPSYPEEISDDAIFLQPHLRDAVSFSKGCYVGQEVLERIDSHGKPPTTLVRLRTSAVETRAEDPVCTGTGDPVGKVLSAATDLTNKEAFVFALVKTKFLDSHESLHLSGKECVVIV